jgi:trafficking protein particle complex subunit 11
MAALRKRAEIDSKHLIVLVEHDETEWNRSLDKSGFLKILFTSYFTVPFFKQSFLSFLVFSLELCLITCVVCHICRLKNVFTELCSTFYKEEGRRTKACIEKRNFVSVELSIRYCFKVRASLFVSVVPLII